MIINIQLNNLKDKIIPINAGLSSRSGTICIENVNVKETIGVYHKSGRNCTLNVPSLTLSDIMDRLGFDNDLVLKMDCEGCEYDVILNNYNHIKAFKELIFEYHSYATNITVSRLLKVLAKEYLCKIVEGDQDIGIIYCIKR